MAVATAYRHSILRDLGLLLARVAIGAIFIAHGSQKIWEWTLGGTAQSFADMGVPFSSIAGPAVAILEFAGGIVLILGTFTPWVGIALAINMAVAAFIAHVPNGVFADNGGWELVGALGAAALALAAAGAGRISLDYLAWGRRRDKRARAEASSDGRRRAEDGSVAA